MSQVQEDLWNNITKSCVYLQYEYWLVTFNWFLHYKYSICMFNWMCSFMDYFGFLSMFRLFFCSLHNFCSTTLLYFSFKCCYFITLSGPHCLYSSYCSVLPTLHMCFSFHLLVLIFVNHSYLLFMFTAQVPIVTFTWSAHTS